MAPRVLFKGTDAIGEAAVRAGCQAYFGYPITPQNELTEYMARRMPELGRVFLQSESEVAAINMVFGAAAAGARVMTTSSSPGISLMMEGFSYIAGARVPMVVVNTERGGPGLGNISPSQGDYFQATKGGGHGDYHFVVLAPSGVQEAANLTYEAFFIADRYRVPVMILSDGIIAQMMEPVEFPEFVDLDSLPDKPWALRGARKVPKSELSEQVLQPKEWYSSGEFEYFPSDDGEHYWERKIIRSLWLHPADGVERNNKILQRIYAQITENEKRYEVLNIGDSGKPKVLVVAYGTVARISKKAVSSIVRDEKSGGGYSFKIFRPITLWPFPYEELAEEAEDTEAVFVFEMSSGQMVEDVALSLGQSLKEYRPIYFYGRMGGGIPTPGELSSFISEVLYGNESFRKKSLWYPGKPNI